MTFNENVQVLFGQNVKKFRKLAGLTQEQLSERLGVSQKHLSIIESGDDYKCNQYVFVILHLHDEAIRLSDSHGMEVPGKVLETCRTL